MTKKELLDYLDSLINSLKRQKQELYDTQINDINDLLEKIKKILSNVEYLENISFEKLDEYINIPDKALNTLTLYQLLCQSEKFPLNKEQKEYIIYMFSEFKKILENKKHDERFRDRDTSVIDNEIMHANNIKDILISKIRISLEDFGIIVNIVREMNIKEKNVLLDNLSNYMKYVMTNLEIGEDYQRKR